MAGVAALVAGLVVAPGPADAGPRPETRGQCISPWVPDLNITGDYVPVVGDFDGNGIDEILWYGPGDAPDSMWRDRGPGTCWKVIRINVRGVYVPLVGDYDFDGRDDIFWFGPGTSYDTLWLGRPDPNSETVTRPFTTNAATVDARSEATARPAVGDFDRNGSDDILFYDPTRTEHPLWYVTPPLFQDPPGRKIEIDAVTVEVGTGYTPIVGAFGDQARRWIFWDGPGKEGDTHWRGLMSRTFVPCVSKCPRGVAGTYQALVGDYDGDHDDDIVWYGAGAANDAFWRVTSRADHEGWSAAGRAFRVSGTYRPLVGDFIGRGRDGIWW